MHVQVTSNGLQQMAMHHPGMHPALHPPPNMHHHLQSMDNSQFDHHGMLSDQNQQQQQLFSDPNGPGQGGYGMIAPPQQQQQPMDSPGVMPNFDLQVGLFFSSMFSVFSLTNLRLCINCQKTKDTNTNQLKVRIISLKQFKKEISVDANLV